MAVNSYGINRGQTEFQIDQPVGATLVENDLEVNFSTLVGWTTAEILQALREIENRILKDNPGILP